MDLGRVSGAGGGDKSRRTGRVKPTTPAGGSEAPESTISTEPASRAPDTLSLSFEAKAKATEAEAKKKADDKIIAEVKASVMSSDKFMNDGALKLVRKTGKRQL